MIISVTIMHYVQSKYIKFIGTSHGTQQQQKNNVKLFWLKNITSVMPPMHLLDCEGNVIPVIYPASAYMPVCWYTWRLTATEVIIYFMLNIKFVVQ